MTISKEALKCIELLIFDLDGTLVDSKKDLVLSVNAMRESMGSGPLSDDLIASYVGRGVGVLVRRALGDQAPEVEIEKAKGIFLDYYWRHMLDHTTVYPGVREALEELRGRKLTVLTNKPVNFSREMLKRLGLAHLFSFVYGGNSFPQKKPDPVGVRKLMSDSGVSAQQALLVGDSDTDVLTGRNAGVWTCGVTYGFAPHTLEDTPPDIVLGDLRDLPLLLDGRMTTNQESGTKDQG
jgi:phosphoglycolate phosphatase